MEWIDLAQDSDKWWAVVNAAMNSATPQCAGQILKQWGNCQFLKKNYFEIAGQLSVSQEELF